MTQRGKDRGSWPDLPYSAWREACTGRHAMPHDWYLCLRPLGETPNQLHIRAHGRRDCCMAEVRLNCPQLTTISEHERLKLTRQKA
jgi:hypothetical protein